jgi:hypothetical protein
LADRAVTEHRYCKAGRLDGWAGPRTIASSITGRLAQSGGPTHQATPIPAEAIERAHVLLGSARGETLPAYPALNPAVAHLASGLTF